jgi:O-antigen/teichoic acid export membrane protein
VNYPVLSKLQDDNEQLVTVYRKLLRTPLFLLYPFLAGLAALANPLIDILLGEKWLPCVPILQILTFAYMWSPLTHINLNLLYVKGRSDLVLKLELIKKPIAFIILFISIPFGIWWMCVGQVVYFFIAFLLNCHYTQKLLNYGFWQQIKELLPIIVNTLIMIAVISATLSCFVNLWLKFACGLLTGVISYLLVAFLTEDESLLFLFRKVKH